MLALSTARLQLRAVQPDEAQELLRGRSPAGLSFAADYPAEFSSEVMGMVVAAGSAGDAGPFFVVRTADGAVIGEIGCSVDGSGTGVTGYGLVESAWGQGYATEALEAVLAHALALPGMERVIGDAPVDRPASGRVMAKAGMRPIGHRHSVEDGVSIELVRYEMVRDEIVRDDMVRDG